MLGHLDILLLFDAAADRDNDFGLGQVDGLLGFFEHFLRLVANDAIGNFDAVTVSTGAALAPASALSPRNAPFWKVANHGASPSEADVGGELALEHLAGEEQLAVFVLEADAVADDGASHGGGELGDEVAHLIGVRHQHQLRLLRGEELFERGGEGIGRVGLELRRFDRIDLRDFLGRDFGGEGRRVCPDDGGFESPAGGRGDGLSGGDRLPGDAVQFAFALFDDYEDGIGHKAVLSSQVLS